MIKEWATVVSWHNGVAQVHCDVKASCSSCASRAGCGSRVLNKLGPQTSHPPTWASNFTGPYLYLPFLLQRHNFCGYAGSNSISWFRGCSVECGVFGLKNVRHSTAAS